MKFTLAEIPQRILVRPNTMDDIQNFGEGNVYPQVIDNAGKASGRLLQCMNIYGRFLVGKGMEQAFYKAIINRRGMTVDKFHRFNVDNFKKFRGFCFQANYNMLGQIVEINPIPFKEIRLAREDENTGMVLKYKHHRDWGREVIKSFDRNKITTYDYFDPNPETVLYQAQKAGGFHKWNGQLFWFSAAGPGKYPEASFDAVLEDVLSDDEAKQFRLNNLQTNFMASHVFEVNEFEGETASSDREAFAKNLKGLQGGRKASRIMVLEKKGTDSPIKITKVDIQDVDGLFEKTISTVKESIRENFLIPPALLDLTPGKLGESDIQTAYQMYNSITVDDRLVFEETYTSIFSKWFTAINPTNNYSIAPLSWGDSTTNTSAGNPPLNQ